MYSLLKDQTLTDSLKSNTKQEKTSTRFSILRMKQKLASCWRSTNYTLKSNLNNTLPCTIAENTQIYGESIWFIQMKHCKQITSDIINQFFSLENQLQCISMNNTHKWQLHGFTITISCKKISTTKILRTNIYANKQRMMLHHKLLNNN